MFVNELVHPFSRRLASIYKRKSSPSLCDLCYKVQRVLIPDGLQQIVVNPDIDKEQTHSVINSTLSTQIKLQLILHLLLLKGPPYVA